MARRSTLRVRLAVRGGYAVSALSRITRQGSGGVIGGRVILALAPTATQALSQGRDVLLVSGTNGKTTTTAFLTAALRTRETVVTNADGANTASGFVTTLADESARTVVLEADEGWVPYAVSETRPQAAVLLNLSRDQLSRHPEVSRLASTWAKSMADVPLVVANADAPDVVWAASPAARQVWVAAGQWWTLDSVACPRCGSACQRSDTHWWCRECGLERPEPDWWVDGDDLVSRTVRVPLRLPLPGRFNRANAAMAVALAAERGVPPEKAVVALRNLTSVAGRYAVHDYAGHRVRLLLAKNPAGWMESLQLVAEGDAPLVLAFNADGVDGRDPSWLYDVPFRELAGRRIVVTGRRATDMEVRLAMDDLDYVDGGRGILESLASLPPGDVDVVANYSAFQDARRELARANGH